MTPSEREPLLFDLPPLDGTEGPAAQHTPAARRRGTASTTGKVLPLFPDLPLRGGPGSAEETQRPHDIATTGAAAAPDPAEEAGLAPRLIAGFADLLLLAAVGTALAFAAHAFLPSGSEWSLYPLLLFVGVFSLFAIVLPLAFWRRTAGMALAKLEVRTLDGSALTFRQSFARWLGGCLTVLGAGVPLLIALSGRSLADRFSGSRTLSR